jgi:hypothetical protein
MAMAVQIELMVDEKGAVSGVRSFDTAVKGTTGSVRQLDAELSAVGTRAAAAGQKGKEGLNQIGKSALSAREETRLLAETMGIHVPRAMQSVISKCPQLMGAISAVSGAMIGLASIQIGAMVFEEAINGAKKLWDHINIVGKAVDNYSDKIEKTRHQEFGTTESIETSRLRIDEASQAASEYSRQAEEAQTKTSGWNASLNLLVPGLGGLVQMWRNFAEAGADVEQEMEALNQMHAAMAADSGQYHDVKELRIGIDAAHREANIGKLPESDRPQAERDAKIREATARAHEERRNANEKLRLQGNTVAPDSGAEKESLQIELATLKADNELSSQRNRHTGDAKSQVQELARIHEQAVESGLRGSALYHQQEAAAIEDLKRRGITAATAINDIHVKFQNEELRRLEEQGRKTEDLERQAAMAGLTGIPRTQAEGANRLANVHDEDFGDVDANGHSVLAERQRAAIATETAVAVHEQSQRDEQEKDRIAAESLAKQRRAAEETTHIEDAAHVKSLSAEKQKTAAIQAELAERKQRYYQEWKDLEISEDDYHRRSKAAEAEANAEMIEAAKAAHDKMAEQFTHLFKSLDHPKEALKELGDKAAGNMAATMVQHFQGKKGGTGADAKGGAGGLFGEMFPGFDFGKKKTLSAGADAKAEMPGGHGGAPMASATFSIASAMIHVGSLSFAGGAGIAPGAPRTSFGGGVGTTLLALGGTGASGGFGAGSTSSLGSDWSTSGRAGNAGEANYEAGHASLGGFGPGSASPAITATERINKGVGAENQAQALYKQGMKFFTGGAGKNGGTGKGGSSESDQDAGYAETKSSDLSGKFNSKGEFVSSRATNNGGMLGGGGVAANAGGAIQGGLGMYAAYEGTGGVGGGAKGALSGYELGMAVGGPIGAGIGAAAGLAIGFYGHGGREEASKYNFRTVKPRIADDQKSYNEGSMNYLSAYADLESLQAEAMKTISKMGPSARAYRKDTIDPEIKQAEGKLTAEEKAGRSQYSSSAAQYDVGTDYVPRTGMAVIHEKERIMPSDQNERITRAIESGASLSAVHASYQSAMQSKDARRVSSGGDRIVQVALSAIDTKSGLQFLMANKHVIRSAFNESLGENSGGGM